MSNVKLSSSSISKEQKAMLAIGLKAVLDVSTAKKDVMETLLSVAGRSNEDLLSEDEMVAKINEAINHLHNGIEELKIFRNMIRDDRPNFQKRQDVFQNRNRNRPRVERNPRDILTQIIKSMDKKADV